MTPDLNECSWGHILITNKNEPYSNPLDTKNPSPPDETTKNDAPSKRVQLGRWGEKMTPNLNVCTLVQGQRQRQRDIDRDRDRDTYRDRDRGTK